MHISKLAKISALLTLIFSTSSFALPIVQPTRCPTVPTIQAEQDKNVVGCKEGDCSFSLPANLYDAEVPWNFVMYLDASSTDEARSKALDAMKSLTYKSGPTKLIPHLWACVYSNDATGVISSAFWSPEKILTQELSKN